MPRSRRASIRVRPRCPGVECAALALCLLFACGAGNARAQVAAGVSGPSIEKLIEEAAELPNEPSGVLTLTTEALEALAVRPDDLLEAKARTLRARAFESLARYPEAESEAQIAVDLLDPAQAPEEAADALRTLGTIQYRRGNAKAAVASAENAAQLQRKHDLQAQLAATLALEGAGHRFLGNLDEALGAHLDSLTICEELQDDACIARASNNIGMVYWQLDRDEQALGYLTRTLDIYRELDLHRQLAQTLNNMGLLLIRVDQAGDALPLLDEALERSRELNNPALVATSLSNLGFAYDELGELDRSKASYEQCLAIRRELQDKKGMARSLGALAELKQGLGNHQEALAMLDEALALAVDVGARVEEADLHRLRSRSHEALGSPRKALTDHQRFYELRQEISGAETDRNILEIELRHEEEHRRREIEQIEREASRLEAAYRDEARRTRLLIGLTVALLASLGLLLAMYRSRVNALREVRSSHERLKTTSSQLAESEERYRRLFEGAKTPTLLIDVERRELLDLNAPAREIVEPKLIDGPLPIDTIRPEWVHDLLPRLLDDPSNPKTIDQDWQDPATSRTLWKQATSDPVTVNGRRCTLATMSDVTADREKLAAQIREDKLGALGVLAGGIAHDFNNALTTIVGESTLAQESDRPEEIHAGIGAILHSAQQAQRLTQQLLAFSKGGEPVRKVQPVAPLLKEALEFARSGTRLQLQVEIDDDLGAASLDDGQFGQVVGNLVLNADQAMDEGGVLLVRASNFFGIPPGTTGPEARFVRLDFVDTGSGVDPRVRDRIFDPYFTTKERGQGLGLAASYAIAQHHGGQLVYQPNPDRGSTFSIFLPASEQTPSLGTKTDETVILGEGRLLLLEDDPGVQQATMSLLTRCGYSVEAVADGEAAIKRYFEAKDRDEPFDLAIMDLTIVGGLGGREALERIRRRDPSVRALVVSGYSADPTMAHYEEAGFQAALSKPFTLHALSQTVHRVLQDRPCDVPS